MKTNVVVLTDVHFSFDAQVEMGCRRGDLSDILLLRAVHRVNRYLKPDLVLCLGDFSNDAKLEETKKIADILALIQCPKIIIPGNHDCEDSLFFNIMPPNEDFLDINGLRFIPFCDEEEPGYNAVRSQQDIERLKSLSQNFDGPLISCQHVPLFQSETVNCPYNYTNAEEIIDAMKLADCRVAISGHFHPGFSSDTQPFGTSIASPCICETPFRFQQLLIDETGKVESKEHILSLPEELELFDCHIHSNFAYCNENMDFAKTVELGKVLNLKGLALTEHTAHLYYSRKEYMNLVPFGVDSIERHAKSKSSRMQEFILQTEKLKTDYTKVGFEVDCDLKGRPIGIEKDLSYADLLLGAIHRLPDTATRHPETIIDCFKFLMENFTDFQFHILAHPFRIFRNMPTEPTEDLFVFVADLLKSKNIAAELNFHTNEPSEKFFSICIEKNVKIALGTDSHNLYEVGELYPHLEFFKRIGCTDISKVLASRINY